MSSWQNFQYSYSYDIVGAAAEGTDGNDKTPFSKEAVRIQRPLIVREIDDMPAFYECEANYYQLKGDIKIGCANAYVREYGKQEIFHYLSAIFPIMCAKAC